MKYCNGCGAEKDESEFHRCNKHGDGLQAYCKDCKRGRVREWRKNNPEKAREQNNRWAKNKHEHKRRYKREYRLDPDVRRKDLARSKLNYAVRAGYIIRPDDCTKCGERSYLEAHHHDYDRPLDVEWLCKECHLEEHHNE